MIGKTSGNKFNTSEFLQTFNQISKTQFRTIYNKQFPIMNRSLLLFFQTLGQCRKFLSEIKIDLVHSEGFKIGQLYKQIDERDAGRIEPNDLYLFLLKKQVKTTESEMFSIFKELDRKKKGQITAHDLSDYFSENSLLSTYKRTQTEQKYEDILISFFNQIIDNDRRLEKIKGEISQNKVSDMFDFLDTKRGGILTLEDIRIFMQNQGASQEIVMEVYYYLSERGIIIISRELFESLIQPFQKPVASPVKTPTFNEISSSKNIWNKQHTNPPLTTQNHLKSTIERLSINSQQTFNIDEFLSKKVEQNKARRQYIEDHQKKRVEYLDEIMKRKSRPSSSASSLKPIRTQIQQESVISQILSPRSVLLTSKINESLSKLSSYKRDVKDVQNQLKQKLHSFRRQESQRTSPDLSFNLSRTMSKANEGDMSSILLKQQRQLQFERYRRIEAENQVVSYKKQLRDMSLKIQSPPPSSLFKPLCGNLSPKIGFISKNNFVKSPRCDQFWKGENRIGQKGGKCLDVGERRSRAKESRDDLGHLEYELMKNRLDMEFNNYKRTKQINTNVYLYR